VQQQDFRDAMARLPSSVVVISTRLGWEYRGLTASSLVSISLDPPMVLVGLEREAATVLTRPQEFIAEMFAGRAPAVDATWSAIPHRLGTNSVPIVEGCAVWLECKLVQVHAAGDHDICVGEVEAAGMGTGDPLILWDRAFWTLR
jgi:flavin reductase (DIM6/NTAB) family NADH-FMN oxidoreductase RutF